MYSPVTVGRVLCTITSCLLLSTYVTAKDADSTSNPDPLHVLLSSMRDRAYPVEGMDSQGILSECDEGAFRPTLSMGVDVTLHSLQIEGTCYQWRDLRHANNRWILMDKPVERCLTRDEARIFLSATLMPPTIRRIDLETAFPIVHIDNIGATNQAAVGRAEKQTCANTERVRPHLPASSSPDISATRTIAANNIPPNVSFAPPMSNREITDMLTQRFAADLSGSYHWFVPVGDSFVVSNGAYFRVASLKLVVPTNECSSPISQTVDVWFAPSGTVARVYFGLATCLV